MTTLLKAECFYRMYGRSIFLRKGHHAKNRLLRVSPSSTINKKFGLGQDFLNFSHLSFFICTMKESDYIGLKVLLILKIVDLESSYIGTRFLLIAGISLPIERSYDTRLEYLRAWQMVGSRSWLNYRCGRDRRHTVITQMTNTLIFTRTSVYLAESSYLLSVSPENILCHGKVKYNGQ